MWSDREDDRSTCSLRRGACHSVTPCVRNAVGLVDVTFRRSANDPAVRSRAPPPPVGSSAFVDFPGVAAGDASFSHDGLLFHFKNV